MLNPIEDFAVSTRSVKDVIQKLKWKRSAGTDQVIAIHLKYEGKLLTVHPSLLKQMIFSQGIVPSSLCIGDLTPISKKEKSKFHCTSFCPVTVATSLCKAFELLFIRELEEVCYTSPHQFGFKQGAGCAEALTAVANTLTDAESSGKNLVWEGLDIRRAFDSLIHTAMLPKPDIRGMYLAIIRSLRDLYSKFRIRQRLSPNKGIPKFHVDNLCQSRKGPVKELSLFPASLTAMYWKHKTCTQLN